MTKNNTKMQKGAAVLLYVSIIAIISVLLMVAAQSRLILALRRNQSSSDSLSTTYQAESVANDYMARLVGGYLTEDAFPINKTFEIGNTKIDVTGTQEENIQTISVTANLSFAVSKVVATREIISIGEFEDVDIVLSLDCTASMDAGATCPNCYTAPTRFDAQKEAALNFVDSVSTLEDADKFRVGISVFGIDSKWLKLGGTDVTPKSGFSYSDIKSAIEAGFGSTRATSPACLTVMDATSVGSPYKMSHEYFSDNEDESTKQIEVVITDGIPNTRIPDNYCTPDVFCPGFPKDSTGVNYCNDNEYGWDCYLGDTYQDGPYDSDNFNIVAYQTCEPLGKDYLRCALATSDTYVSEIGKDGGLRNPKVDAYAVTIFSSPPSDVVTIFKKYATPDGYFNASQADQLSSILEEVLANIISERSVINVKRSIPK